MRYRAIGIFDSGVGGLTVCKEIIRQLPGENLIYLGDTARVPYGTKSAQTVERYALEAASFLVEQGVKLLVVACNTASAVALPALRERFQLPVIGVIEPGAQRAADSRNRRIGVIGTEGTINSGRYEEAIRARVPDAKVLTAACPLFVPLAEECWSEHEVARLTAEEYLQPLRQAKVDTLVLGCTHYPLLRKTIQQVMGPDVLLVDSAEETARAVADLFAEQGLALPELGGRRDFYVTDVPTRFERVGRAFLGRELGRVQQVQIG
ncbi:glutamate racemase [Malonomonas rubra DSM 5091]|uniref:Glutamate racemase n=1 Tax=Malonomonas rubra DSM 5091 TaxID=1122189 RepID=A0A1M6GPG2_MALRU|nr:glutamate racemase [Malonomonas rubra]SHJ11750.1 glutamate racemase [Malonomonas rubra DSM 5091]